MGNRIHRAFGLS